MGKRLIRICRYCLWYLKKSPFTAVGPCRISWNQSHVDTLQNKTNSQKEIIFQVIIYLFHLRLNIACFNFPNHPHSPTRYPSITPFGCKHRTKTSSISQSSSSSLKKLEERHVHDRSRHGMKEQSRQGHHPPWRHPVHGVGSHRRLAGHHDHRVVSHALLRPSCRGEERANAAA